MRMFQAALMAGVLAVAAPAFAGTVTATLNDVSPSVTNLQVSFNGSSFESCYIGELNWINKTGTDTLLGSSFFTYCIDGVQNVYLNSSASWTVGSLTDSPHPITNYPDGMGAERAARLTDFWDRHITGITTAQQAAAFQIGIWEIVYDSPMASGNMNFSADLFNGNFKLQDTASVHSDASVTLAQSWLSDLSSPGTFPQYTMYALQSDTMQDQVFGILPPSPGPSPSVPLPAALPAGLSLLGGLGVFAKLRRRRD